MVEGRQPISEIERLDDVWLSFYRRHVEEYLTRKREAQEESIRNANRNA